MSEDLKSKIREDGKVIIKKDAFRNIYTHVLRFGSQMREEAEQVMGICVGKISDNGSDIILSNAIPLIHGKKVEEEFSEDLKNTVEKIEENFRAKNLTVYGWYHSHVGLGLFYSTSDIKNQQYFQFKEGPYDFGIVIDPTEIKKEKDFGLKVFQLSERSPEGYSEKKYELEKPNTLEFFKWVQKFVEDYHRKDPTIIKEINETQEGSSMELEEIPSVFEIYEEDIFNEKLVGEGLNTYLTNLKISLNEQMKPWMNDISRGTTEGSKKLKETTLSMKDNIKFAKIKRWFSRTTEEVIKNLQDNITMYLNSRIQAEQEMINSINSFSDSMKKFQEEKIDHNITEMLNKNQREAVNITKEINQLKEKNLNLKEKTKILSPVIEKLQTEISENLKNDLKNQLEGDYTSLKVLIENHIEKMKNTIEKSNASQLEILDLIDKLEKMIITIRNI
ncbi:MAG: hypothetical protein EU550_03660 [Promethearchaeota archaeon]|nr:MAG: hypothetical protein EU550_03660 [Candidatus Lokiarchaeota archaeon]